MHSILELVAVNSAQIPMERRNPPLKKTKGEIDGDLQSRQLATYGMSVMERLAGASVLIIGMNGLGVEVAKNIVLANVKRVTLADDRVASLRDMGSHFYLQLDDVGNTNRAEACLRSIKDVNPGVDVTCWTAPISEELLADHDAVCVCDGVCRGEDEMASFKWNEFCRCRGVSFIRCEARGVFGYVFDDLTSPVDGPGKYCVPDPGHTIAHISNSKTAVVTIDQPNVWGSLVGKTVRFSGIHGMLELNGVRAVVAAQEYRALFGNDRQLLVTLKDVDTSGMAAYRNGGVMTVDPFETVHQFTSFRDAWLCGATAENDASAWPLVGDHGQNDNPFGLQCESFGMPNKHITRMLRAAFRALENDPGRTFNPGNEAEALAFVDEICGVIKLFDPRDFFTGDEFDCEKSIDNREAVVDGMRPFFITFAMSCAGSINAVCACVGGIAAQEIIKSIALIEEPLSQFLFVSFADILPKPLPTFEEVSPRNSRYDSHIAVLGAPFHSELRKLKVRCVRV
jgi:ubiquitin-activating enzyme E1